MTKTGNVLKVAFLSMLVAAFTVASTGVLATTNTTTVVNSGDDVEVETESKVETDIEVSNENEANIEQYVEANANTGYNEANGNISFGGGGTSIETGRASVDVEADVKANENMTLIGFGYYGGTSNMTDVVNTGNDVEIEAETETDTEIDVENDNTAEVLQEAYLNSNTGFNDANDNIGGTSIDTSNAQVESDMDANVNSNLTLIGGGYDFGLSSLNGSHGLNNETVITNTGNNADIETEVESETEIDVENDNDLWVEQYLEGNSNSGYNDANDNIGGAEVMTGSAMLASRMHVSGNTNATGIGGSYLWPDSENMTDVVNTGDDLETEAETEIEMEVDVENDSELAGGQWYYINSDTGFNMTNDNIGSSSVDSGPAGTSADLDFGGNKNTTVLGLLGSLLSLLAI